MTTTIRCLLCGLLLVPLLVDAQEKEREDIFVLGKEVLLARAKAIRFRTNDRITDGCWPEPGASKIAVEAVLRRNGFEFLESKSYVPTLWLSGLGYAIGDGCIATIELRFLHPVPAKVAHDSPDFAVLYYEAFSRRSIFSSPKSDMNSDISETLEDWAEMFVLEVRKAREKIFKLRPDIKEEFERAGSE